MTTIGRPALNTERKKMMEVLREVCRENKDNKEWLELSEEDRETILRRMERDCMNKIVKECGEKFMDRCWAKKEFVERYSTELYRHISSLRSGDYLKRLSKGELDPKLVAELSNSEIAPENYEEEIKIINKRMEQQIKEKYTTKHTCKICKGRKIKYQETSGRSLGADEISQFYYKCADCGYGWME